MNASDLTPSQFIQRTQTQAAIRRWLAPLALSTVFALVPIALEHLQPADNHGLLAEQRFVQAEARLDVAKSQITTIQAELKQQQRELQAAEHLTGRPDWTAVLTLVAGQFEGQLMMTGCQLGTANDRTIRSGLGQLQADVPEDSVWLMLSGIAGTNSDVPGLIMRLEALGLFQRVVMTASQRDTVAGGSRTTFMLACKVTSGGDQ